jgi:hypothetical protein
MEGCACGECLCLWGVFVERGQWESANGAVCSLVAAKGGAAAAVSG